MDGNAQRSRPSSWAVRRRSHARAEAPAALTPLSRARITALADELADNVSEGETRDVASVRRFFAKERSAETAEIAALDVGPVERAASFIHNLAARVFAARQEELAHALLDAAESVPLRIPTSMLLSGSPDSYTGGIDEGSGASQGVVGAELMQQHMMQAAEGGGGRSVAPSSYGEARAMIDEGLGAELTLADVGECAHLFVAVFVC